MHSVCQISNLQEMNIISVIYSESKFIERNRGDVIELLQIQSTGLRKMGRHISRLCVCYCCPNHTQDLSQRGHCSDPLDSSIFRSSLAWLALVLHSCPCKLFCLKILGITMQPCSPSAGPASCVLIQN